MTEKELLEMFADNLQAALDDCGITPSELAEETGISRSNIYCYVNGERMPTVKNLINLMVALDCEFYDLIDDIEHID